MSRRPTPPKWWEPNGDDYDTNTPYLGPEYCVGDGLKVILLQIYDMVELDGMQVYEIMALLDALVKTHVVEYDELEEC